MGLKVGLVTGNRSLKKSNLKNWTYVYYQSYFKPFT